MRFPVAGWKTTTQVPRHGGALLLPCRSAIDLRQSRQDAKRARKKRASSWRLGVLAELAHSWVGPESVRHAGGGQVRPQEGVEDVPAAALEGDLLGAKLEA